MKCKNCDRKLPRGSTICISCGKKQPKSSNDCPDCEENPEIKKPKVGGILLAVVSGVVAAGIVIMAVLWLLGVFAPRDNNIYYKDNYTVSNLFMGKRMQNVVATVGDEQLTNAQLQVFYWMHIYNYAQYYEADFTKPLHKQVMDEETGMTWQQYFLECALTSWKQYQTVTSMAEKADFELPEEYKKNIVALETEAKVSAQENGFKSVDDMLAVDFGKGVTMDEYKRFFYLYYMSNLYFEEMKSKLEVTEEEMDAYFQENKDNLRTYWGVGITKDIGKLTDVRHILITPTGGTVVDGKTVYTEKEWADCLVKAQKIYDEWLAGKATEETFAEAAYRYTDDGNGDDGGLYLDISKGIMVKEYEDWCFDESRKYGDHGMVKTQYGYHIMFYVGGEDGYERYCGQGALEIKSMEYLENLMETTQMDVDYTKMVLANIDLTSK